MQKQEIDKFYEDVERLQLRFPVAEISKQTGFGKGQVSDYLNRNKEPSGNFLTAFYKSFNKSLTNVPRESMVSEPASYLDKRRDQKNNGIKKDVPVFGGFTTLGNIQVYDDGNVKNKIVGHLPADFFPNCDYAERAKGDSMYPLIMNQALLIGKTCNIKGITFGEKYIIKTKDGMDTTKFVHPGSEGFIKLKAYNKSVPDQEIKTSEIVFVCRVYWIVNPT